MISVIFCSRVKGNPDSNVRRLLDSVVAQTTPAERAHLEFLIKYDDDDDERPPDAFFASYPLTIRTFCWSRGEGRHGLHHVQEYLFAQRDPRARFCLMTADDFYFTRTGFVSEILAVKDEFCIIGRAMQDAGQLVGEVEGVMDATVQSHAADRAVDVGGVAGEHHTA